MRKTTLYICENDCHKSTRVYKLVENCFHFLYLYACISASTTALCSNLSVIHLYKMSVTLTFTNTVLFLKLSDTTKIPTGRWFARGFKKFRHNIFVLQTFYINLSFLFYYFMYY